MNFEQLSAQRHSVRRFTNKPVEAEKLELVLAAARNAPTAGNRQPQRILVISSPDGLQKIDRCTRCRFGAPVVFLVGYDSSACWVRPFDNAKSGEIDASIVTTQMMLQAADIGLGTTWVMHFDPAQLAKEFPLPVNFVPVALLVLGEPASDSTASERHTLRKPLENLVSREIFA
jgi:nitroreductase